jgi:transcriptional regulator with XRE-family HTH domain
MLKIKRIRALLADRNLAAVARKTSLHVNTVRAIASGINKNPLPETIKKLSKYLSVR